MKEAWYVKKYGANWASEILGPFETEEHAQLVARWKTLEDPIPVAGWGVGWTERHWEGISPYGQRDLRARGLAPE
jgi:hypothetical protein